MRAFLPLLFFFATACVDVQHVLQLSDDGGVSYRLTMTPTGPSIVSASALSLVPDPSSGVVRAWQDRLDGQLVWIIQGQFPNAESFAAWSNTAWTGATQRWPNVPGSVRPPHLTQGATRQDWTVEWAPVTAPGASEIVLIGAQADPPAPHIDRAGGQHWSFIPPAAPQLRATLRRPTRFALGRFFAEGGPSLGFALAGLGLLAWVYRRMRRQHWRRQKAHSA